MQQTLNYQQLINQRADQCVKCGMCSSHCPTYQLAKDENESPRGRISLMQALVNNQLPLSKPLQQHLDHCLGCRSCEKVCPSGVVYGELIDTTRAYIANTHLPNNKLSARIQTRLIKLIAFKQKPLRLLSQLLRLYQKIGLQRLMRTTRLLHYLGLAHLDQLLPPIPQQTRWQLYYPPDTQLPNSQQRGQVALFIGCITDVLDKQTLLATINLLNRIGYGVHVPPQQVCCGAMALHHGATQIATDCINTNISAFSNTKYEAILYIASGCGATLMEYHKINHTLKIKNAEADKVAAKVIDAGEFLLNQPATATLPFQPLDQSIALHTPCTLRNVIKKPDVPQSLLALIPKLKITATNTQNLCCGAAGTHMLLQKKLANQLGQTLLSELLQTEAQLLATTNIGCYLHLRRLLQSSSKQPICHPITLLKQQLPTRSLSYTQHCDKT